MAPKMTKNSETQLALAKNGEKREKIMFSLNDLKELMSILTKTDPNDEMDDDQTDQQAPWEQKDFNMEFVQAKFAMITARIDRYEKSVDDLEDDMEMRKQYQQKPSH